MQWLRNFVVLALALVLTNSADAAKAKKKVKPIKGSVVEVKKDADKDTGTIVVKIAPKKKDPNAVAVEKTFKVADTTTIARLPGKKEKGSPATSIKIGDVQAGDKVTVTAKDDSATDIKVAAKKKKKNK